MTDSNFGGSLPVMVGEGEDPAPFERVSVNDSVFDEAYLQSLLEEHPEVLPLADLDLLFSPATCVGREIQTPSGNLDNLFISPSGGLTLVETKLWRNPESRRQVVAQIIDYAQQMARWTYADLERRVAAYLARKHNWSGTLYDWLTDRFEELDEEAVFRDRVSANLENGRFLLLIVGNGIQRNVQDMVSYLQGAPQLQFNLALVRLNCYRRSGQQQPLLFIPSIVTKTAEVERAVVRIEMSEEAKKSVSPSVKVPATDTQVTAGEEAFYTQLRRSIGDSLTEQTRQFVAALEQEPAVDTAIQTRLVVKLFFEAKGAEQGVWLFVVKPNGTVFIGGQGKWRKQIIPRTVIEEFWRDVGKSCPTMHPKISGKSVSAPTVAIADVLPHADTIVAAARRYIAKVQELDSDS